MPLKVIRTKKITTNDYIILKLAKKLLENLKENFISVEAFEGWDGSNVRIVVKEASMDTVKKVIETIQKVEEEVGKPGLFIPDVVEENMTMENDFSVKFNEQEFEELKKRLKEKLGNTIVSVEAFEGWDGSNVRIVVKEASMDTVKKVIETIQKVEEEVGKPGLFIPDVVEENAIC